MLDRAGVIPPTLPDLAPTPEDMAMAGEDEGMPEGSGPEPIEDEDPEEEGMETRPPESDEERDNMPKAARKGRPQMPKQGTLFRRHQRVHRVAKLAKATDDAILEGQRAQALAALTAGQVEGALEGFVLEAHLPEREGGEGWLSGPALPAYQTPAHVGIRSRLGVTENDTELLEYSAPPKG